MFKPIHLDIRPDKSFADENLADPDDDDGDVAVVENLASIKIYITPRPS